MLNAAAAKSNGAELQVQAVPIRDLQLGASVQYLDMYFTSFSNAPGFIPQPGGASTPITVDAAGNQSPFAPKWTATLTGAYSFRTPTGTYTIGGNYYYDHGYYFDAQNRTSQNPYSLAGAYSEWTSHDDRFSIQLWAKNLGDRRYNTIVKPTELWRHNHARLTAHLWDNRTSAVAMRKIVGEMPLRVTRIKFQESRAYEDSSLQ